MTVQPDLLDWLELLGLRQSIERLLAGRITISDTLDALQAAREHYPHISQDYIEILDITRAFLEEIRTRIEDQAQAIDAFNKAASDTPYSFNRPGDRLLTQDEYKRFLALQAQLAQDEAMARRQQDALNKEAQDLEDEMERLAEDALDEAEDALRDLQDALEEMEDARDEYEDRLNDRGTERPGGLGADRERRKAQEWIDSMAYWDFLMEAPLIEGEESEAANEY